LEQVRTYKFRLKDGGSKRKRLRRHAGKTERVKAIHAKIANIRKYWNHKTANAILKGAKQVIVGNGNALDASWVQLKSVLEYKAKGLGIDFNSHLLVLF
jgi:transposase